jgi:ABC-type branched-subunit amino acid transport system permease subunit
VPPLRAGRLRWPLHVNARWEKEKKMSEVTRSFLLWCTVVDYGILLVWFLVFVFAHDWIQRTHGRWFRLSREQFDALHYAGMSIFKIGIILFNLVPFLVLSILG